MLMLVSAGFLAADAADSKPLLQRSSCPRMTNTSEMPSLTVEDYHIGWVCALPKEMTAALSMLDEEHPILGKQQHDNNNYALGRIHNHNVVIACMPAGADGLVNAANVARDMARTFPALRVCLMVGIGGGIPNLKKASTCDLEISSSVNPMVLGGVLCNMIKGRQKVEGNLF